VAGPAAGRDDELRVTILCHFARISLEIGTLDSAIMWQKSQYSANVSQLLIRKSRVLSPAHPPKNPNYHNRLLVLDRKQN
jgi:hypothetical protein